MPFTLPAGPKFQMHHPVLKSNLPRLLAAALVGLTGCSSTPNGPEETQRTSVIEARNGAMVVDTVTVVATVKAIDPATRKLTLITANGIQTPVTASKAIVNFDQIKVGDQIKVQATEAFAASLHPTGQRARRGAITSVVVAPRGALPGDISANTKEITAQLTAIDAKSRQVTLQFFDGNSARIKVGATVNLKAVKPGDAVAVCVAESLAIVVTKP